MKLLFGTLALGIAMLSFAGANDKPQVASCATTSIQVYQDTIPKKDTTRKKDRKNKKDNKERRDTLSYR